MRTRRLRVAPTLRVRPQTAVELLHEKQRAYREQARKESNPVQAAHLMTVALVLGEIAEALLDSKDSGIA